MSRALYQKIIKFEAWLAAGCRCRRCCASIRSAGFITHTHNRTHARARTHTHTNARARLLVEPLQYILV